MDLKRNLHSIRRRDMDPDTVLQNQAKKEAFWKESRQKAILEKDAISQQTMIVLENFKARLLNTSAALVESNNAFSKFLDDFDNREKKLQDVWVAINRYNPFLESNFMREQQLQQPLLSSGKRMHQSNVEDEVIVPVDLACQLGNILNIKLQQQHSLPSRNSPPSFRSESRFLVPEVDMISMSASERDARNDPPIDQKTVMYLFHIFGLIYSRLMDEVDLTEKQSQSVEQIFIDLGVRQLGPAASPSAYREAFNSSEQDEEALSSISSKVKLIIQSIETKIGSKEKVKKKTLVDIPVNSLSPSPRLTSTSASASASASTDEIKPYSYHQGGGGVVTRKRQRKTPLQSSQDKENAFPLFDDSVSASTDRRPLSSSPLTPTMAGVTATTRMDSKQKTTSKKSKDLPTTAFSKIAATKKGLFEQEYLSSSDTSQDEMRSKVESLSATVESRTMELQSLRDAMRQSDQEKETLREELIFMQLEAEKFKDKNESLEVIREQFQEFRLRQQQKARALRIELVSAKRDIRQLEERVKERDSEILSGRKSVNDSAFGCMDDIYQVDEVFESNSLPRDRLRNANALIAYSKHHTYPSPVKYCDDYGDDNGASAMAFSPTPDNEDVARQLMETINVAELQQVEIANQQTAIQILASENEVLRTECASSSQRVTALESEAEELQQQIVEVLQIAEDQAAKLRVIECDSITVTVSDSGGQYPPDNMTNGIQDPPGNAEVSGAAGRLTSNLCVECAMMTSIRIGNLESEKERLHQQILEVLQIAEYQADKLRSLQCNSPVSSAISSCSRVSLNSSNDGGDDNIEVMIGNSDSDSDSDRDGLFTTLFDESIDRSEWGEVPVQPDLNASKISWTEACRATRSPYRKGRDRNSIEDQRFSIKDNVESLVVLFESSIKNILDRFNITEADIRDEIKLLRLKFQELLLSYRAEESTIATTLSTLSECNPTSPIDTKELKASMATLKTEIMQLKRILKTFQSDFESSNGRNSPTQLSEDGSSDGDSTQILAVMSEMRGTLTARFSSFQSLKESYSALQREKVMLNKKLSLMAASAVWERDAFAEKLYRAQNVFDEMRGAYESQQKSLDAEIQTVNTRLLTCISEKDACVQAWKDEIDKLSSQLSSSARLNAEFQSEVEVEREKCEHISTEYANYALSLKEEIKQLKDELETASLSYERTVYALKVERKVLIDKTMRMASSRQEERAQLLLALAEEREKSASLLESFKQDLKEARQAYDILGEYILNSQITGLKQQIETIHLGTSQVVNSLRLEADQLKELLNKTKATSAHTIEILKREIASWREQLASSTQESNKIIAVLKEEARKMKLQKETMIEESTAIVSNLQKELTELVESVHTLRQEAESEIAVLKEKRCSHELHKVQMISSWEDEKKKMKQQMDEEQRHFLVSVALLQDEVHQLYLAHERDDIGGKGAELRRRLHELQDDVRRWRVSLGDNSDNAGVISAVEVMKTTYKELEEYKSTLESTRRQLKSTGRAFEEKVSLCHLQSERIAMQDADNETLQEKITSFAASKAAELSRLLERIADLERNLEDQKESHKLSSQEKLSEEMLLVHRIREETSLSNARVHELEQAIVRLSEEYSSFRKEAEDVDRKYVEQIEQLQRDYSSISHKYAKQTNALHEVVERLNAREEELGKITTQYFGKEPHRPPPTRPQYDIRKLQADIEARPALPSTQFIRREKFPTPEKFSSPGAGDDDAAALSLPSEFT